jgi:hypothetical protein
MARVATDAAGAAPLTDENDHKMQMTILPLECLDSRVKSNPVFSGAIILASLLESYYRYRFRFGFWESVWTAS